MYRLPHRTGVYSNAVQGGSCPARCKHDSGQTSMVNRDRNLTYPLFETVFVLEYYVFDGIAVPLPMTSVDPRIFPESRFTSYFALYVLLGGIQ